MPLELLPSPQSFGNQTEHPATILIIDDDDAMVDVLAWRLGQQGFDVRSTASGEQGLVMAHERRPTLILLDLRLPDADGFVICQRLTDSSATCDIPVLIVSAMEGPDIIRRARIAGAQFFLRKPYDPNVLLVLIHQAILEQAGLCD